jgi:hypothetical protein
LFTLVSEAYPLIWPVTSLLIENPGLSSCQLLVPDCWFSSTIGLGAGSAANAASSGNLDTINSTAARRTTSRTRDRPARIYRAKPIVINPPESHDGGRAALMTDITLRQIECCFARNACGRHQQLGRRHSYIAKAATTIQSVSAVLRRRGGRRSGLRGRRLKPLNGSRPLG